MEACSLGALVLYRLANRPHESLYRLSLAASTDLSLPIHAKRSVCPSAPRDGQGDDRCIAIIVVSSSSVSTYLFRAKFQFNSRICKAMNNGLCMVKHNTHSQAAQDFLECLDMVKELASALFSKTKLAVRRQNACTSKRTISTNALRRLTDMQVGESP